MKKPLLVILGLASCAAFASAQNKTSLTGKCDPKKATSQVMEAGDRPNHTLGVVKNTCTVSNATEMEGLKTKGYTYTATFDLTGTKATQRGYAVVEMDNGDKAFVRFQGNATNKPDGSSDSDEGTWSYTGGTGKLKGI